MKYPTHDTEWATSAKGNTWRRIKGIGLVVGKRKDGRWWALCGEDFIKGSFSTKQEAKNAAELGLEGEDTSEHEDDEYWG